MDISHQSRARTGGLAAALCVAFAVAAVLLFAGGASAQDEPPTPAVATPSIECYEANGRTDGMLVVNFTASSDGSSFFTTIGPAGRQLTRSVGVGASLDYTLRVSGRPDGPLLLAVYEGTDDTGTVLFDDALAVDCDPFVGPEAAITNGCINETGRFDLFVENPGPANADYTLRVNNLSKTANVFAGEIKRVTITGRVDGDYTVSAERDGLVVLPEMVITSDCEPDTIIIRSTCIANDGLVQLYVPGPDPALTYSIGTVGPRKYVQTPSSNRGVASARPDGTHAVTLFSASGAIAGTGEVTVDCDDPASCDLGYVESAGQCVTPGPLACVAPDLVLTSFPGVQGADPSDSCIPESTCPWGGNGAYIRDGRVHCSVFLP